MSVINDGGLLAELHVRQTLSQQIKEKQALDEELVKRVHQMEQGMLRDFTLNEEGVICFCGRLCVTNSEELQRVILKEVHNSPYVMHPDSNKIWSIKKSGTSTGRHVAKLFFGVRRKLEMLFTLAEFDYNINYQAIIQIAPFETLYGRRCRTPLCWTDLDEKRIVGPDRETKDKVNIICERLKSASDR
ncbi:uncharacterized protein [Gossypium hirsutum]|uniref:Uncharacterized protein n=1 Tax=Gossypium hirsutum TaxID=3635 RepID=A0A1U8N1M4_GOSHI|nr:uncharacterized protein LOC107942517 [Gossypium hirsutum]